MLVEIAFGGVVDMVGCYEEMADFAAMSEDDGFLGQCAGEAADLSVASPQPITPGLQDMKFLRRGPQQLQLLVIPKRAADRTA